MVYNTWLILGLSFVLLLVTFSVLLYTRPLKEGFTWSPDTIQSFGMFEATMNPRFFFDLSSVQQQASEQEVKELLKTGQWPWNPIVKRVFVDHVQTNPMVKWQPEAAMQYARGIYNNKAAEMLLSWDEPEGQFLLSGAFVRDNHAKNMYAGFGTYGENSGLVAPNKDVIRCEKVGNRYQLQRTRNLGNDGIFGQHTYMKTPVDYRLLPGLLPGFSFSPRVGPCNPCVALQDPPDYSCPFSLHEQDKGVSSIWRHLWSR